MREVSLIGAGGNRIRVDAADEVKCVACGEPILACEWARDVFLIGNGERGVVAHARHFLGDNPDRGAQTWRIAEAIAWVVGRPRASAPATDTGLFEPQG